MYDLAQRRIKRPRGPGQIRVQRVTTFFRPKSSDKKRKVITSADVHFSPQNQV